MGPLAGIELKLARADECLALLHGQRALFLRDHAHGLRGHLDVETGECAFRIAEPPPVEWGVTVGEYAHLMRSVLDNLLCVVLQARLARVSRRHQFPIYEKSADFFRKSKKHPIPKGEWQTRGVSADDFAFMQGCQPFETRPDLPQWEPLSLLGQLNNEDKHRSIHVSAAAASVVARTGPYAGRPFVIGSDPVARLRSTNVDGFLAILYVNGSANGAGYSFVGSDDRAEVLRFRGVSDAPADAEVEVQPRPLVEVSFCNRKRPVTIFDLMDIRSTVVEIVDWFRPRI